MFIKNEQTNKTLKKRLTELIQKSDEMKFLVGFFYFSGISQLYESLKEKEESDETVNLKVLVGLNVDKHLSTLVEHGEGHEGAGSERANNFLESIKNSINSKQFDTSDFYEQTQFFLKLINDEKLIIRKTYTPNHAKLYYFNLKTDQAIPDIFITGSSNLTKAGVDTQDELNVEISDHGTEDAKDYFDRLWSDAVKITEDDALKNKLLDVVQDETLVADVSPFEAYALTLKSYLDTQKHVDEPASINELLKKNDYTRYQYQVDAVTQALSIIDDHNGVIISDVVGLGKSIVASLVAHSLKKRGLILTPPGLMGDENNQSGWRKYKEEFGLYDWEVRSTGKLDKALELVRNNDEYEVVIIDEAHNFRNQDTQSYEALLNICRGKQVMLLTATPFNNSPSDIFSLLKLFETPGKSGITLSDNLENKFAHYNGQFRKLTYIAKYYDSQDKSRREKSKRHYNKIFDTEDSIDIKRVRSEIHKISDKIRNVIEPVMIRRNRIDLQEDPKYKDEVKDMVRPEDPGELFYELDDEQMAFYERVLTDYFGEYGEFTGAIYRPFEYEQGKQAAEIDEGELNEEENRQFISQRNLFDFMRRLIVKRFESSFGSFRQSIKNFRRATNAALNYIERRDKFVLDRDFMEKASQMDEDEYQEYLEDFERSLEEEDTSEHNKVYNVSNFVDEEGFISDIKRDLELYTKILRELEELDLFKQNDPKVSSLVEVLHGKLQNLNESDDPERKLIIFSEYTDTIKYLEDELADEFGDNILSAAGSLTSTKIETILKNFDASHSNPEDEYKILLATDKLAEGFNLNRAGAIINFDIPWNPTRVIQRIGRINRISKRVFKKLYIFNFFPTKRGAEVVKQRQIAEDKMFLIHNTLGEDAKIFSPDEEPTKSGLYKRLQSNPDDETDESPFTQIKKLYSDIEENHSDTIERISKLPPLVKVSKEAKDQYAMSVFIRKGRGFFIRNYMNETIQNDLSIVDILPLIKAEKDEERLPLDAEFWKKYNSTKDIRNTADKDSAPGGAQSLEGQARNNLKTLLQPNYRESIRLPDYLYTFIEDLIADIHEYKTLTINTHRRLSNLDTKNIAREEITKELKKLHYEIGADFLNNTKDRAKELKDEVIIAIENKQL